MDLEVWVIELLKDISDAGARNENFDLHMEAPYVQEIAKLYNETKWIEIV